MKRKTITPMGALHPILFFAGVYFVALFFSIFICSSVFYSCNASSSDGFLSKKEIKTQEATPAAKTLVAASSR
jgi:hypothetical protein